MKHSIRFTCVLFVGILLLGTLAVNGIVLYETAQMLTEENAGGGELHLFLSYREHILSRLLFMLSVHIMFIGCLALGGYILLSRKVLAPIRTLIEDGRKLAGGDFTHPIHASGENELGELADMLSQISHRVRMSRVPLHKACEEIKQLSYLIRSRFEKHVSSHQGQFNILARMQHTVDDMTDSIQHITSKAEHIRDDMTSSLSSMQHLETTLEQTVNSMKDMREQTRKNTERVVLLGEKISQINNVVKMINTIADHTKLIAFNTSIEAAGAGEAGGRFSVVATEIRRLASTVVESLEDIRRSVASIQTATSDLILSSETGIRKVNQGTEHIAEIGSSMHTMLALLDNTNHTADEIANRIHQEQAHNVLIVEGINEMSSHVDDDTEQTRHTYEKIQTLCERVEELEHTLRYLPCRTI